jgi:hypothetical protein
MSRTIVAFLAALLGLGMAPVQAPQAQEQAQVETSPKVALPASVGGATLSRSANTANGTSYQYTAPNGMEITVDVYNDGRRVPNGSSHPTIINQFSDELNVIRQQAQASGMTGFEKPAVPSACTYGSYTLRCIVFSASGTSLTGRIYGKFLLIGYRDNFVKIIIRWTQTGGQTPADADKILTAFVPALLVR